jgi:hypothetical protein
MEAQLSMRKPQGINPAILMLDLHLVQKPGMNTQVMTWVNVRYDNTVNPANTKYSQVKIFYKNKSIADVKVEEVH